MRMNACTRQQPQILRSGLYLQRICSRRLSFPDSTPQRASYVCATAIGEVSKASASDMESGKDAMEKPSSVGAGASFKSTPDGIMMQGYTLWRQSQTLLVHTCRTGHCEYVLQMPQFHVFRDIHHARDSSILPPRYPAMSQHSNNPLSALETTAANDYIIVRSCMSHTHPCARRRGIGASATTHNTSTQSIVRSSIS
jgi:hypothetical protein